MERYVFLYLFSNANYLDGKTAPKNFNNPVVRGQLVTGLKVISEATGYTFQQIRSSLEWLICNKQITSKSTNKGRLITILDYDKFQSYEQAEQQTDFPEINKQITNKQQHHKNIRIKESKIYTPHPFDLNLYTSWKSFAESNSTTSKPNEKTWCETFRKIRTIDKIPESKMLEVLEFVKTDDFWNKKALSPVGLRTRSKNGLLKIENVINAMELHNPNETVGISVEQQLAERYGKSEK